MLVALACLDWVAEHVGHRGVRSLANFVLLGAFTLGLEYLLGGGTAVVETLTALTPATVLPVTALELSRAVSLG